MPQSDITFVRPELEDVLDKYTTIRDCITQRVKDEKQTYLPQPNPDDLTPANTKRYSSYWTRAIFYDVTSRTLNGLVGQVFSNEPIIELPAQLATLEVDANGNGLTLAQNAKEATRYATAYGRCGLFVDYPITNGQPTTVAQLTSGEIKPTISVYAPENIINWQKTRRGANHIYSLIVLFENKQVQIDDFKFETKPSWKALRLKPNAATGKNEYYIEIYTQKSARAPTAPALILPNGEALGRDNPAAGADLYDVQTLTPTDAKGLPLEEIPFDFIGADNNDSDIDPAPLFSMAELNIGHYRNSADYEEACFIVGQPTYVVSGLTDEWYKTVLKEKLEVGSRGGIPLNVGAKAEILQVAPNAMPKEAMEQKEKQMAAIGAKLVEQKQVQQTATEAGINSTADNSALANIANNVSAAFTSALKRALLFTGGTGKPEFTLNTDFAINRMSAQDQTQLIASWTSGAISFTEMRRSLRESGIAFQDDIEAQKEMDAQIEKKATQAADAAKAMADAVPPAPVVAAPAAPVGKAKPSSGA